MQVADIGQKGPWIATVYFVEDDHQNLYWLSLPTRRHSQELAVNNRAAIAITVQGEQPVIGIQAEGVVSVVENGPVIQTIMEKYVAKYSAGHDFYNNFIAGKNQHRLYKFTPENFVLFDELNFAENPRQEWKPQN